MNVKEAANQARKYAHGSRFHQDAMGVLFQAYRRSLPHDPNPSLENLWAWVDGYLSMERASYEPSPLG